MSVSQNGWTVIGYPGASRVPGTLVDLAVRAGSAGKILLHVAAQIDQRVEDIDNARGHIDDGGWNVRPIIGGSDTSNHASGTAIDIDWNKHPLGAVGTWANWQYDEIHRILAEIPYGVVRWGGDYANPARGGVAGSRVDEMHFEINASAAQVDKAWNELNRRLLSAEVPKLKEIDMTVLDLPPRFAYDANKKIIDKTAIVRIVGEWTGSSFLGELKASASIYCHWKIDPHTALVLPEIAYQEKDNSIQWVPQSIVTLKHFKEAYWVHLDGGQFGVSAGLVENDFDFSVPVSLNLQYAAK